MNIRTIRTAILCLGLQLATSAGAQQHSIIPHPAVLTPHAGAFRIPFEWKASFDAGAAAWRNELHALRDRLSRAAGVRLVHAGEKDAGATLKVRSAAGMATPGAYTLDVAQDGITITAGDATGVFHATQTLLQLLPPSVESDTRTDASGWSVPALHIKDEPAFGHRGLMLDVARHFMPLDFLRKVVRLMAMQKLNRLHLHLTDDQGWRMEIRKYPRLTEVGGKRGGTLKGRYPGKGSDEIAHAGHYSQQELRQLVAYASAHHVEIIPEIELPGHASAAIAAYPELSCFPRESTSVIPSMTSAKALKAVERPGTKVVQETWGVFTDVLCPTEYTFGFMKHVLDEVMEVFPSRYIHIGGDECPKDAWKRSPYCQELIRNRGLKDEHGLQSHFIREMEKHINSRGRSIIGWDEILEGGLAPNATVMSWRGISGGVEAARQSHDVVMSPVERCYLNLYQSEDPTDSIAWGGLTTLRQVYAYDPVPKELTAREATYIKGIQANLWSEYIKSPALAEYMLFPRLLAVAETGWSRDKPGFADFTRRLGPWFERLRAAGVNHSNHVYELACEGSFDSRTGRMTVKVTGGPADNAGLRYAIDDNPSAAYGMPFEIDGSCRVTAMVVTDGRVGDRAVRSFRIGRGTGGEATLKTPADAPYDKGGPSAWTNGIVGSDTRYTDGEWLGFNGRDFDGTVYIKGEAPLSSVTVRYFHAPDSWVHAPAMVEVYGAGDGGDFALLGRKGTEAYGESGAREMRIDFPQGRYSALRVVARNHGAIGAGSPGAGNPAWLFIDEAYIR